MKRRALLKAGGATSALIGLGALGRFLDFSTKPDNTVAPHVISHDYVLEFRPHALLLRSPQMLQVLKECMSHIVQETNGKILPVLVTDDNQVIESDKQRIRVGLSSPSLKVSPTSKSLSFFSRFPQGLNHDDKKKWLTSDIGMKLWEQAYAQWNLKPLYFGQGPATEYQLLSRAPSEILNVHSLFLTTSPRSLRAQLSRKEIVTIRKYQKLMISHHMPFESDALPAVTILQKGIIDEKNLHVIASNFLSSSVFEMNLDKKTWDQLPQDIKGLLTQISRQGGDRFTGLLKEKEEAAIQEISLISDAQWELRDLKNSERARELIVHASPQNLEIAKAYESFRKTKLSSIKKIS